MNYSKSDIISRLKPQCCAYSTVDCNALIEFPQTDEECVFLKNTLNGKALLSVSRDFARSIGFEELAKWTTSSDYLFLSRDSTILLNMPRSLFCD